MYIFFDFSGYSSDVEIGGAPPMPYRGGFGGGRGGFRGGRGGGGRGGGGPPMGGGRYNRGGSAIGKRIFTVFYSISMKGPSWALF